MSIYVGYYFYFNSNVKILIYLKETKEDILIFLTPKNIQFSEKGPEIGFCVYLKKMLNGSQLFSLCSFKRKERYFYTSDFSSYFRIFCKQFPFPKIGLCRPKYIFFSFSFQFFLFFVQKTPEIIISLF